jgi:hypothetical protein
MALALPSRSVATVKAWSVTTPSLRGGRGGGAREIDLAHGGLAGGDGEGFGRGVVSGERDGDRGRAGGDVGEDEGAVVFGVGHAAGAVEADLGVAHVFAGGGIEDAALDGAGGLGEGGGHEGEGEQEEHAGGVPEENGIHGWRGGGWDGADRQARDGGNRRGSGKAGMQLPALLPGGREREISDTGDEARQRGAVVGNR